MEFDNVMPAAISGVSTVTGLASGAGAATTNAAAINAAGLSMFNAGGGTVIIPAGTWYIDSTIQLYSKVTYQGVAAAIDMNSSTLYGTVLIGTVKTFPAFSYNANNLVYTPAPYANGAAWIADMIFGAGVNTICLRSFDYGIKVGGNYHSGSQCGIWDTIYCVDCNWGFWFENCQEDLYTQFITVAHTTGAGMFASTAGNFADANTWQCGNCTGYQLFSQQGSSNPTLQYKVKSWCFSANPSGSIQGGSSLNNMTFASIQSNRGSGGFSQTSASMFANGSSTITVTDTSVFAVGMPVVFDTAPPAPFTQYKPYFVKQILSSTTMTLSDYMYGTVISVTGASGSGTLASFGFAHLEFTGASSTQLVQPCSFKGVDIEGASTTPLLFQYTKGISIETGGFIGLTKQYPIDYQVSSTPITVAAGNYVVTAAYRSGSATTITNWPVEFSYSMDNSSNGNTVLGGYQAPTPPGSIGGYKPVGYSTLQNNRSGNARLATQSGIITLSQANGANFGINQYTNAVEVFSGGLSFPTTGKGSGSSFPSNATAPGSSSIAYTTASAGTLTLPTIVANGEGQFFIVSNPQAFTVTISTSSAQNIVGGGTAATSLALAANTCAVLLSCVAGGTYYWAKI